MASSFQVLNRRFGNARPGMQLYAVQEAAIPVTIVQAAVLAQQRKPLPIIEEFLLRLVAAGVTEGPDVAEMLGLKRDQWLDAAAAQVSENNLHHRANTLTLTAQGTEVVRNLAATQPVVKTLPVVFDRLVWELADHNRSILLTKKDALEQGLLLLPAAKKAHIGLGDVTAEGFNTLLRAQHDGVPKVEVLRVRKVAPNTHRYLPVQLLVYGDSARQAPELAVCIEGELQPDHGFALDAINAVETLGLSIGESDPRPELEPELERQRVEVADVEQMAAAALEDNPATNTAPQVEELAVRGVSVFEHPDLLMQALDTAKQRLLIMAPWVKSAVVNTTFLSKLEQRLRRGVKVTIAHGMGKDDSGSDKQALKRLANLASRYQDSFTFVRLKNSHAKILIFDGHWILTSFNWLSFRGDPSRTYRIEEGTLVAIPAKVDEAYDRYIQLVAEQKV